MEKKFYYKGSMLTSVLGGVYYISADSSLKDLKKKLNTTQAYLTRFNKCIHYHINKWTSDKNGKD